MTHARGETVNDGVADCLDERPVSDATLHDRETEVCSAGGGVEFGGRETS